MIAMCGMMELQKDSWSQELKVFVSTEKPTALRKVSSFACKGKPSVPNRVVPSGWLMEDDEGQVGRLDRSVSFLSSTPGV